MNRRSETKGRRAPLLLLAALALTLLCELALFNWKALLTLGQSWEALPSPTVSGDLAEERSLALFYNDLNREIRWCHIGIEVRNAKGEVVPTRFILRLSDEGSSEVYQAGEVSYWPGHDKAAWFPLHSYGQVRRLTVEILADEPGCTCRVRTAEVNGSVPFRISLPRIAGLFALFVLLRLLRPGSGIWDNRFWNRRWAKGLCVLLILTLNLGALWTLARSNRTLNNIPEKPNWVQHGQYAKLARALAEGRTWIDEEEEKEALALLGSMQNPYDPPARTALFQKNDLHYDWDTAYYNGHYYVYFGVVPVLLTYLPWYLLTGSDLSTVCAAVLAGALAVIAAFLFLRVLVRRYFPRTPFPVYVLLSLLMGNCTGVLCYAVDPTFYVLPVNLSLAFVLFGMALWLSAAERWDLALEGTPLRREAEGTCFAPLRSPGRRCSVALRIAAGALLCALTAGCRPQFLVFSVLALPIFRPLLLREPQKTVRIRRILAFALPYAAVAAPLMYYNYIRFGSPFDFGANYNLTTNDMTRRGFHLARLPDGLFAYLFRLPNVELQFPYIQETSTTPIYMGRTIKESMFGGVFLVFPFLWSLLGTRRVRPLLRVKKLRGLVILPLVLALIVVIADTEMAGILWRYTGDFLPLLFLAAGIVFLALLQTSRPRRRRTLLRFLTAATLLALLTCLLISMTNSSFLQRDPENYFRLKDLLSIS